MAETPGAPSGRIIDIAGRGIKSNQDENDIRLEPGVIIVHCVLAPETGAIQIHRSERSVPPKTNQEVRVEMDNWFSVLAYSLALLMVNMEMHFGVPREKVIPILLGVIDGYFARGMSQKPIDAGQTKKENQATKEKEEPAVKINYDADLIALGYHKINDITYNEYVLEKGLSDREKSKTPIAAEFNDSIVFRKSLDCGGAGNVFLEIARSKELVPHPLDKKVSKYMVALSCIDPGYTSKHYWQITEPEKIVALLKKIEEEATQIARILF